MSALTLARVFEAQLGREFFIVWQPAKAINATNPHAVLVSIGSESYVFFLSERM